jgi:biotin synthase-related radical SAM superfamily protein
MLAVAEKVASISTIEYLEKRTKRGSREKYLAILNKAPEVVPEEFDKE